MPALSQVLSLIPSIPLPHLLVVLALAVVGLAGFTVHAVVNLAKRRDQ